MKNIWEVHMIRVLQMRFEQISLPFQVAHFISENSVKFESPR